MTTTVRRSLTTVLATCLVLTGFATTASAEPQGHDVHDHGAGRFYANFDIDVLLFTGAEVTDICDGAAEPIVQARVFHRQDGSTELKVNARDLPVFLYHSPLGAPEFVDATCQAMFDGDPATEPVAPFASGTAGFKERISAGTDGVEEHFNGVNGVATGPDGTAWKVRTWADFTVDNGELVGDPAEFQGLAIHRMGG